MVVVVVMVVAVVEVAGGLVVKVVLEGSIGPGWQEVCGCRK